MHITLTTPALLSLLCRAGAAALTAAVLGCSTAPHSPPSKPELRLEVVAELPQQLTGVAVSRTGRLFVNVPSWVDKPSPSLAEVTDRGEVKPFPNAEWNQWDGQPGESAANHFVCVQAVWVDGKDRLWVVDSASPNFSGVVPGGAKLVEVDLATNTVARVYSFDSTVAPPASYLNDVRVEPSRRYAFLTDSGLGALLVVDLESGRIRRLLETHPSVKAEPLELTVQKYPWRNAQGQTPAIHSDGIAMAPDGRYLYYHALTGHTLYRVPVMALINEGLSPEALAAQVERLATTAAADGMEMDSKGRLYLTDLENDAVVSWTPEEGVRPVVSDPQLAWPDSLAVDPQGRVYVTASQIHRMPGFNDGEDRRQRPFQVFRFTP